MSAHMVLLPVFVLVGLTFAFFFWTGSRRRGPLAGRANASDTGEALYDPLQLAMLFYVLIALALPLRHADAGLPCRSFRRSFRHPERCQKPLAGLLLGRAGAVGDVAVFRAAHFFADLTAPHPLPLAEGYP
jgi:hypothetical protein